MKIKKIAIVTSLAVYGIISSGSITTVLAATFRWSYTARSGDVFAGFLKGTRESEQNIVDVTSAYNTTINGTPTAATPYVYSVSSGLANPSNPLPPGLVSFNGAVMDFGACTELICANMDGFAFGSYYPYTPPGLLFATGSSFGNITEPFNSANWRLATVPEPSFNLGLGAIAFLGLGAGLKSGLTRHRSKRKGKKPTFTSESG